MASKKPVQTNQPKITKPTDEKPKGTTTKPSNTGKQDKSIQRGAGNK